MKPPNPKSVVFTLSALWILWSFGFQTLWVRYPTELEGVVVYSHHTSRTPRYGTEYVIRDASGHDTHNVAGATDASLDRSIPVGSRIEKKWGQLGYALDGEWQSFPVVFYGAAMGLAVPALSGSARSGPPKRITALEPRKAAPNREDRVREKAPPFSLASCPYLAAPSPMMENGAQNAG